MKLIKVDKDYDEINLTRHVRIQDERYRCVSGVHSLVRASEEAQQEKNRGVKGVKVLVCNSYFVCVPDAGSSGITLKDVARTAKKATLIVNKAAGATLDGHNRGTESVKKFLGWRN